MLVWIDEGLEILFSWVIYVFYVILINVLRLDVLIVVLYFAVKSGDGFTFWI